MSEQQISDPEWTNLELVTLPIEDITPYWRNPRKITDDAVSAVAESIERYGYVQPIVVDPENVIVVGHTRHQALKKLGRTEAAVYVTRLPEDKIREYRLVDNRTGEMTQWDHRALLLELREFETDLMDRYFPDVDLEIETINAASHEVTEKDLAAAEKAATQLPGDDTPPRDLMVEVSCPKCESTFQLKASSLPGISTGDLREMDREKAPRASDAAAAG